MKSIDSKLQINNKLRIYFTNNCPIYAQSDKHFSNSGQKILLTKKIIISLKIKQKQKKSSLNNSYALWHS
jgi:hypothetical protein